MNTPRRRRTYKQAVRSRQYRRASLWLWTCTFAGAAWFMLRWTHYIAQQFGIAP